MKEEKRSPCTLLSVLRLLLLVAFARGQAARPVRRQNELTLSSEEEALGALWSLEHGRVIRLGLGSVQLNATIVIEAADVVIRGSDQRTRLRCPRDGNGAFVIRGTNLTLSFLEFSDCRGQAAVIVEGTAIRESDFAERTEDSSPSTEDAPEGLQSFVRLSSCLFQSNRAHSGAAIHAEQSRLLIDNTTFSANHATQDGGAIFANHTDLRINGSIFIDNRSSEGNGGAVSVEDCQTLIVEHSRFEGNSAKSDRWLHGSGGVLFALRVDSVSVTKSLFGKNAAGRDGGGMYAAQCRTVTVNATRFGYNAAGTDGGGVYAERCHAVYAEASRFENNTAAVDGGGIGASKSDTIVTTKSHFRKNTAGKDGGGLAAWKSNTVIVEKSHFWNNAAGDDGGGVCAFKSNKLSVEDSRFEDNDAEDDGGGVAATVCKTAIVNESDFRNNTAGYGGGVGAPHCRNVTLSRSRFELNRAANGGGVSAPDCKTVMLSHLKLKNNAAGDDGGAVYSRLSELVTVRHAVFHNNRAVGKGGGVSVSNGTVAMEASRFENNDARGSGGGLFASGAGRMTLSNSTFREQSSGASGGAICVEASESLSVRATSFEKNSAHGDGGALCALATELETEGCQFVDNSAGEAGGAVSLSDRCEWSIRGSVALERNEATSGGAISLSDSASLAVRDEGSAATLKGNAALQGGGLFCSTCSVTIAGGVRFVENVAAKSGGGAHAADAASFVVEGATFEKNVASFGGGTFLRDCRRASLTECDFTSNLATHGGGFHIASESGLRERYHMRRVHLVRNRALDIAAVGHDHAALRWKRQREKALSEGDGARPESERRFGARGGAGLMALRNDREASSAVRVKLDGVFAKNNSADLGGAIFVENGDRDAVRGECTDGGPDRSWCLSLRFENVHLVGNSASVAGGGLFVPSPRSPEAYGFREGASHEECADDGVRHDAFCFRDNRVSGGEGYGPQRASDAWSLELRNVRRPLENMNAGDRLAVRGEGDGAEEIEVAVKDAFGQTVEGRTEDSGLAVLLLSNWISGERRYTAEHGVAKISSTFVTGIDVSDSLVVQSDDGRNISVAVRFSTLPCLNGALPTDSRSTCFRCPAQSYAFRPRSEDCRPCEKHANCSGTATLVPEDGHWHSTPFSPFIRRCPVRTACSFEGRARSLGSYYNDTEIDAKLRRFKSVAGDATADSAEDYQQCAPGYEGVLCGSCAGGYGHSAGGKCERCGYSFATTRLLTVMGLLVLFSVLTGKVALGVDSTRRYLSDDLAKEKMAVSTMLTRLRHKSPSLGQQDETKGVEQSADAQTAGPEEEERDDEGTSAQPVEKPPSLRRSRARIEEPSECGSDGTRPPSDAIVSASGVLVASFNIFFNYVQLSTVALSLDVDWRAALNGLFSMLAALGRIMHIELLPFDCNFGDRGEDVGVPNSILVLWSRICFPLLAAAVYLFVGAGLKLARPRKRSSKYIPQFAPSLILIFLIVYLASCIDVVGDLLEALRCIDLVSGTDASHPYAEFEHLELVSVWVRDTSVTCWRGAHLTSAIFASLGLSLCLAAIALMVITLNRGSGRETLKDPEFVRRYGILYIGYRPEGLALHWECVVTLRKMLLSTIEVFGRRGEASGVAIGLLAIVIFASIGLHDIVQPFEHEYAEDTFPDYAGDELKFFLPERLRSRWAALNQSVTLNGLESASLFMSLSFFLVAGCISDEKVNNLESSLLVASCFFLNSVFILFMLYRLWYGLHLYLDVLADESGLSLTYAPGIDDRQTYLWLKAWTLATSVARETENADSAPESP